MTLVDSSYLESIVKAAIAEDLGSGDITTALTVPRSTIAKASIVTREPLVVAGMAIPHEVFFGVTYPEYWGIWDEDLLCTEYEPLCKDGDTLEAGAALAQIEGPAHSILTGERVALNFLQRMSGIATMTRRYVELVAGTKARIVDTRKTTPGLRRLEKYAVAVGGGHNHRFGLSDGILIKDNHIAVAGGVAAAVSAAKAGAPHTLKIEVEVDTINQLDEAITAGADVVLLDNMSVEMLREAVELAAGRVLLEASGGVNEENVRAIAETGVDIISVGALTHSARAIDISMEITCQ
jgi:nicotinate-nucleotide pyrophosphorylase (carboxylating)